jgi:hypothetical protein
MTHIKLWEYGKEMKGGQPRRLLRHHLPRQRRGGGGGGGRATERDVKIIRMRKIINQHLTPAGITSNRGGENSFHSSNLGIIGMMKSVQDKFPDL